jgi:hypothetical protein
MREKEEGELREVNYGKGSIKFLE